MLSAPSRPALADTGKKPGAPCRTHEIERLQPRQERQRPRHVLSPLRPQLVRVLRGHRQGEEASIKTQSN